MVACVIFPEIVTDELREGSRETEGERKVKKLS